MNAVINVLKKPNALAVIILIILIAVTLGLGSIFQVSWLFRIIISLFLILIVVIVLLYKKMKDTQKAGQIENSISSQADNQMQNLSPEKKAEIDQFKKQLEAAIASLKNSKLGKGKTGKAALYALPWYMIIGPSAAGKTTAIQNSGLEFPFGKDGFRGVGGTRNCDWFFSTQGIFLDTAGRYVTQTEDRAEWISFLEVLRKNRKKKPVNGVIIALNIDEIINSEKDQLYAHAKNIRSRIDELIENLGVNFPVYFIFTKCDLIQGFVEYFGDFSEIERSQVWGATFSAHQMTGSNQKENFESEFDKLSEKLFKIRTIRLSSPLKREQRRKVFLFPFQFKSLRNKLTYLIGEVFQYNPYQDNPLFRGFYFTSGTQEGLPLDVAIREIAKQFNLPVSSEDDLSEITETKNYFIKDLLGSIVIGDQNFRIGQTSGVVKKRSVTRMVTASVSLLILFILSLFTFIGYNGSSDFLDEVAETSESFKKINWSGNLLNNFLIADNMLDLIKRAEEGNANRAFVGFGMDRSENLLEPLKQLYLDKTQPFFTQNIYDELAKHLNNYANGRDYPDGEIYSYLKSYLLLGNERSRYDTSSYKLMTNVFSGLLESKFIASNVMASSAEKDSLKRFFNNYVSFFSRNLNDRNFFNVRDDNILVSIVRNRLQYKPSADGIYARLKQNAISRFNDLSLEQMIGGRYTFVVNTDQKVPYIFTADGWVNYFQDAIIEESINPGKEDWVLGKTQVSAASEPQFDSEQMKKDLMKLYLNDYHQTWVQFLQSIKYSGFETVPIAANNLKIIADPVNSPLLLVLKFTSDHLKIIADIQSTSDSLTGSISKIKVGNINLVDVNKVRKFISADDGSAAPDLNAIIGQYGIISGIFENIKGGQDLAKDYAANVLSQRAVELPSAMQLIKNSLYNVPQLQNMFLEPVRLSWKAILADASQYINTQWKAKVYDNYNRTLANSFPFKANNNDAPFQDFKDFFRPGDGIMWSFFNEELKEFINKERWRVNQWENEGVRFSTDFISALKKADDITGTLFRTGDMNVSFRLRPRLPDSKPVMGQKPIVEQIYLNIDGVEDYYRMGSPFWKDYSWPGRTGAPGVRMNVSIRGYGNSDTKSFDGEWALFRLLEDASVSRGESSTQFIFNWSFRKDTYYDITVTYDLNTTSSKNPFAAGFFKSFSLPSKIN
jgi:type VI secretion system protein ImpL